MKYYVQFFLLSAFIVAATCFHFHANDDELTWESMIEYVQTNDETKEDKLTANKFAYKVGRTSQQFCILANMTISLTLPPEEGSKTLNVPKNAIVEGTCLSLISELKFRWNETAEDMNVITFTFINDHTSFSVFSIDVDIELNKKTFFNADKRRLKGSLKNLHLFHASVNTGIHTCEKRKLTIEKMDMTISDVSLIAFNTEYDISKRTEEKCTDGDEKEESFPYKLKNNAGDTCVLAKWSIVFDIPYKTKTNQEKKQAKVTVPSQVTVTGQCDTILSQMNLIWSETALLAADGKQNSVSFIFTKNKTNSFVSSMLAQIYVDEKNFPDAAELGTQVKVNTLLDHPMFLAQAENGIYSCKDAKTLKIDDVTVTISDVILVAFDVQKELISKIVTDCQYAFPIDGFNYIVYDKENSIPCTLAKMAITMNVSYETTTNSNASKVLTIPSKLDVDGVCDAQWSTLKLTWPSSTEQNSPNNTITFYITKDDKETNFYVYRIDTTVQLDKQNFPDANKQKPLTGSTKGFLSLFNADASAGLYRCKDFTHRVKVGEIDLNITDVLFVAYNKETNLNSKRVNDCFSSPTTTEPSTESTTVPTTQTKTETTLTPNPSVKKFNYVVMDQQTHIPCVLANMTINLTIPYKTKDSKSETKTVQVPFTAETSGTCKETNATMNLIGWSPEMPKAETVQNTITFVFQTDKSTFHLDSVSVFFNFDEKNFPNAAEKNCNVTTKKLNVFSTSMKNMYTCTAATVLDADGVQISIGNVTLIAFNTQENVASRTEENCQANETDTNVGAIVGGIIGGLILLSIIIYVVISWRRGHIYR